MSLLSLSLRFLNITSGSAGGMLSNKDSVGCEVESAFSKGIWEADSGVWKDEDETNFEKGEERCWILEFEIKAEADLWKDVGEILVIGDLENWKIEGEAKFVREEGEERNTEFEAWKEDDIWKVVGAILVIGVWENWNLDGEKVAWKSEVVIELGIKGGGVRKIEIDDWFWVVAAWAWSIIAGAVVGIIDSGSLDREFEFETCVGKGTELTKGIEGRVWLGWTSTGFDTKPFVSFLAAIVAFLLAFAADFFCSAFSSAANFLAAVSSAVSISMALSNNNYKK